MIKNPTTRSHEHVGSLLRGHCFEIINPMKYRPESWRDRLEAQDEDSRAFLLLGQTLVQLLDLADRGFAPEGARILMEQAASVDWRKAYLNSPQVMAEMAKSIDLPATAELPSNDKALGPVLRETMDRLKGFMKRIDGLTDQRTGLFTHAAMKTKELKRVMDAVLPQLGRFLIELKVATDHVLALMIWKTTMRDLLISAEAGDDTALCKVLSVNPLLAYHASIGQRIQQATAHREHLILRQIQKAIAKRPPRHKNAKAGFIMAGLWEARLKRLPSRQIQGFLRDVGASQRPFPTGLGTVCTTVGTQEVLHRVAKDGE